MAEQAGAGELPAWGASTLFLYEVVFLISDGSHLHDGPFSMEEQMESSTELAKLEQFVDKLLTKYHELKDNFHKLQATLRERDSEIVDLKEQIAELSNERAHVGERVAGLIDRIEEWEAEQEMDDDPQSGSEAASAEDGQDQAGLQGSLFNEGGDNA